MTGHQALIAMRESRRKPAAAFVHLLDHLTTALPAWASAEKALEFGPFAQIEILPTDDVALLDFRFLIGMRVHLNGSNPRRVFVLLDRITEFEPARIVASGFAPDYLVEWTPETGLIELEFA